MLNDEQRGEQDVLNEYLTRKRADSRPKRGGLARNSVEKPVQSNDKGIA